MISARFIFFFPCTNFLQISCRLRKLQVFLFLCTVYPCGGIFSHYQSPNLYKNNHFFFTLSPHPAGKQFTSLFRNPDSHMPHTILSTVPFLRCQPDPRKPGKSLAQSRFKSNASKSFPKLRQNLLFLRRSPAVAASSPVSPVADSLIHPRHSNVCRIVSKTVSYVFPDTGFFLSFAAISMISAPHLTPACRSAGWRP